MSEYNYYKMMLSYVYYTKQQSIKCVDELLISEKFLLRIGSQYLRLQLDNDFKTLIIH